MQPTGPQASEDWQPPQEAGPQAPYQVPRPSSTEDLANSQERQLDDEASLRDDDSAKSTTEDNGDDALIRWQGTEYIHKEHTTSWYIVLTIVTVALMAVAFLFMRSRTFTLLLPVMAATLVIYTRRPPVVNNYTLSRKGLYIDDKLYAYSQFKSFSVVSHNEVHSVVLVPRKRFQIAQTIYFPEDIGEPLVDLLAARLPMKEGGPDAIDRLLARLHL